MPATAKRLMPRQTLRRLQADARVQGFRDWCRLRGLPEPQAEHRFCDRRWRFDYAWVPQLVALEVEGGIWMKGGGRHSRGSGMLADMLKYNTATVFGWRVLRATPQTLKSRETLWMLREVLK